MKITERLVNSKIETENQRLFSTRTMHIEQLTRLKDTFVSGHLHWLSKIQPTCQIVWPHLFADAAKHIHVSDGVFPHACSVPTHSTKHPYLEMAFNYYYPLKFYSE